MAENYSMSDVRFLLNFLPVEYKRAAFKGLKITYNDKPNVDEWNDEMVNERFRTVLDRLNGDIPIQDDYTGMHIRGIADGIYKYIHE